MALKNFGFAPGGGTDPTVSGPAGQQERIRRLFQRLPNTELIKDPGIDSVHQFIEKIAADFDADTPIGNAFIGGHADSEGNIFIPMFPDQEKVVQDVDANQTNFEVLDATVAPGHPEQSINMDDIIDDAGNHFVHFKGCNIGKVTPFLKKFREVLDADGVSALMFFHGVIWESATGVWEYIAYEFKLFQKSPFKTRAAVVTAFKNGGFKLISGNPVPTDRWETWVPKKDFKKSSAKKLTFQLGQTVNVLPNVKNRKTLKAEQQYRVESNQKHPFRWRVTGLSPFPAKANFFNTLAESIRDAPEFKTDHPFPFFARWGYANVDAFINGLTWTFRRGKGSEVNTLIATGTRTEVTLLIPVTDPADSHLFFSFHPHDPTAEGIPTTQLGEDDATFYGIVTESTP
jgi:hypothetical protein